MPIAEWKQEYELGIQPFDDHHQHLFALLNKTYDIFVNDAPKEELALILDELIDYAVYHFAAEEYWMRRNRYPALDQHACQHDHFSRRAVELQTSYAKGETGLTLEVLQFLNSWLSEHILKSDAAFKQFSPPATS